MVDAVNDKPVSFSKETERINDLKINFQTPKKEQSARKCPYFISIVLNNVSIIYVKAKKSLAKILFLVKMTASSFVSTKLKVSCRQKIFVFPTKIEIYTSQIPTS